MSNDAPCARALPLSLTLPPVILTAVKIQSPFHHSCCHRSGTIVILTAVGIPFRCANAVMATKIATGLAGQAFPAPAYRVFQPAIKSPHPRHSHRSGNPERCARLWQRRCDRVGGQAIPLLRRTDSFSRHQISHPPSFSPQWESRALSMRQRGYSNEDATGWRAGDSPAPAYRFFQPSSNLPPTPRHSHRSGNPEPYRCANLMRVCRNAPGRTLQVGRRPVHPARLGPMRRAYSSSLTPTPRHSHRSGNPEPYRCANAAMATKIRQVSGQAFPPRKYSAGRVNHSRFNRSTGIA